MALLRSFASAFFFLLCAAAAAVMLLPAVLGYQRYVITSGSMTGTYDTGSIVYDKVVPAASLTVGDVITYAPPAGKSPTALVTHRIASITADPQSGERVFVTKGDHNAVVDPWTFKLRGATQAQVAFGIPYAGFAFAFLGDPAHRQLVIGLPAALIALLVLLGMVREARAERRAALLPA